MKTLVTICLSLMLSLPVWADSSLTNSESQLLAIQQQWAHINYELEGDAKTDAFIALIPEAEALVKAQPQQAENYIWLGIVQSSTAGAKGGLGALKYAKAARKSLEEALRLDENALQGSALTSLGVLYHKVPGWPIGFGSDKKAEQLLTQALKINPQGIDPNYFYAEYLYDNGDYELAKNHLVIARNAPPRPDRPLADSGRQQEVSILWDKVKQK